MFKTRSNLLRRGLGREKGIVGGFPSEGSGAWGTGVWGPEIGLLNSSMTIVKG